MSLKQSHNPVRASLVSGAAIVVSALAVVFGSSVREKLEYGGPLAAHRHTADLSGLMASRGKDVIVSETDYFRDMVRLLKREYVEPIDDERKLALGAVRGMVGSLRDPRCLFLDPDEFRVYKLAQQGRYEGIGVELVFDTGADPKLDSGVLQTQDVEAAPVTSMAIPRLRVVATTPGGPADKAGVKVGDWVDSIDNQWVANPEPILRYREAAKRASPEAIKGLSAPEAQKRQEHYRTLGRELKAMAKTMIMPMRAKDRLTVGDSGSMTIVWKRDDVTRTTKIARAESSLPSTLIAGQPLVLRLAPGVSQELAKAIRGQSEVTLDLRNNPRGDFASLKACLAVLAPEGNYGEIRATRKEKTRPLTVVQGNGKPPKMTILVNSSTRGPAEILALALASKGRGKLVGRTGGDRAWIDTVPLSDGSGYTLNTGEYAPPKAPKTGTGAKKAAMRKVRKVATIPLIPRVLIAASPRSQGVAS